MGIMNYLPFGKNKYYLSALIVYPTKKVKKVKIEGDKPTFAVDDGQFKRMYAIDQKAIYFFNKEPVLFYTSGSSSPLIIGNDIQSSMNSSEFRSILESKAVSEILEASKGSGLDLHFIASVISAIGVIILFLQNGGLGFLGVGG